jgi:hypothetical protein
MHYAAACTTSLWASQRAATGLTTAKPSPPTSPTAMHASTTRSNTRRKPPSRKRHCERVRTPNDPGWSSQRACRSTDRLSQAKRACISLKPDRQPISATERPPLRGLLVQKLPPRATSLLCAELIIDVAILNAGTCSVAPDNTIRALLPANLAIRLRHDDFGIYEAQRA